MAKKLIIAEKPSVAGDIARSLGGFARTGDYYESDRYVLSSAVGHLLELAVPEEYEVKRGKWSFKHLPVIPPRFELAPLEKSEQRLNLLLRLMKRKDVSALINACDAGREGELIFRYIVQHARIKKPIERLWLQSMTPQAIRDGFSKLRPDRELLPLADAAKSRSEADWLVGINGTRAMTAFNSKEGGFYLTTVGRVQTPTLAILVEREEKIKAFTPRDYWEVHARFGAKAGEYPARWFDPNFKKDDDFERKPERIWDAKQASSIVAACEGKKGVANEETKPSTQLSPLLFDLTGLQREANGRFGFPARMTLSLAQALYERHKVLTYPRTDSRALPEDYLGTVKDTLKELAETNAFGTFARQILKQSWVKPNKRIFDNAKISDHFAIIPTLQTPKHLNEAEGKLYDMVVRRFLAVFYPAAEYLQTTRITKVAAYHFKTEGRVLRSAGWLAVYGRAAGEDEKTLPAIEANESVRVLEVLRQANQTKPPPRFTEATLLSAMEGAGKLVDDDELREAMAEKGLGTPATRAAIIEGLIREEYVNREARELVPTPKAFSLLRRVHEADQRARAQGGRRHQDRRDSRRGVRHRAGTVPEVRQGARTGELPQVPVPEVRFRHLEGDLRTRVVARGGGRAHHQARRRPAHRFSQQAGPPIQRARALKRGPASGVRLRASLGRRRRSTGLQQPGAARQVPEVRRAHLRARRDLCVRERRWRQAQLRLPLRARDPAAAGRARADEEAARHRPHRSAHGFRVQERTALQGVPGEDPRQQDRFRVPGAGRQGQARRGEEGSARRLDV